MHINKRLYEAFMANDIATIDVIFKETPKLTKRRFAVGGDWLYFAASECNVNVMEYLLELGFDPNAKAEMEGDNSLCSAARYGRTENVKFLLNLNVELDVSESVRNPLFAAVQNGHADIVRLLLDAGIDPSVKYFGPVMNGMDAATFAVWNHQPNCSKVIIQHIAQGDENKAKTLWADAQRVEEKLTQ